MDNGTGIMPVMPIGGNGVDSFGGGGFWIFALLILAMMGGNGFGMITAKVLTFQRILQRHFLLKLE